MSHNKLLLHSHQTVTFSPDTYILTRLLHSHQIVTFSPDWGLLHSHQTGDCLHSHQTGDCYILTRLGTVTFSPDWDCYILTRLGTVTFSPDWDCYISKSHHVDFIINARDHHVSWILVLLCLLHLHLEGAVKIWQKSWNSRIRALWFQPFDSNPSYTCIMSMSQGIQCRRTSCSLGQSCLEDLNSNQSV